MDSDRELSKEWKWVGGREEKGMCVYLQIKEYVPISELKWTK